MSEATTICLRCHGLGAINLRYDSDGTRQHDPCPECKSTTTGWAETRASWTRLCRALRWALIEWHLNMVVRLVRPDDPDALPLLEALSKRYDRWSAKP